MLLPAAPEGAGSGSNQQGVERLPAAHPPETALMPVHGEIGALSQMGAKVQFFRRGEILRKVPQEKLVDALMEEIAKLP